MNFSYYIYLFGAIALQLVCGMALCSTLAIQL